MGLFTKSKTTEEKELILLSKKWEERINNIGSDHLKFHSISSWDGSIFLTYKDIAGEYFVPYYESYNMSDDKLLEYAQLYIANINKEKEIKQFKEEISTREGMKKFILEIIKSR